MASTSGGRKRRLVSTLDGEVLERLSMKLNPRMLMKDYQSLAGRLKYPYEYIRNFERERDPTLALLQHWWSSKRGKEKTVTVLIEHLSDMERDDAVDLLRPHEFYSSHEASDNDENAERPVIAGATDLNVNPYNPHFPAREDCYQRQANQYGASIPGVTASYYNGHGTFPDQRENDQRQTNAPPQRINQAPRLGYYNNLHQDQLNQKMFDMKLNNNNKFANNYSGTVPTTSTFFPNGSCPSNNYPAMVPSTSTSFPNGSCPSSVSSSMDSLQFEKYFMGKEDVSPKQPISPQYPAATAPRFNMDANKLHPLIPDEFYGARRDLRLHNRPRPLDGSTGSSSEAGMSREFLGSPRHDRMMRDSRDMRGYEQYMGAAVDMRYWPRDYRHYESSAAAESHSMTVAADKVALVIGNQDYCHEKLRGLLCPEKDAADVADALRQLQFRVISLVNLTLSEMRTAMLAFCCLLGRGVYGVVYYAGHGYEDNGENYLLPVDSDLKYNREHSLRTQEILEAMQECETSLNLLIIDACRVSLPNKSGTKVPRIKRNTKGNNIFAYSCTSQQESVEVSNHENGMYCFHLLRRIRENRRVENVLMDVATDFARAYGLPQRPCLETDSMADFRLTDPIQSDLLEDEYGERCRRWNEAQRHPQPFPLEAGGVRLMLEFSARFSNVLCVSVIVEKIIQKSITEFHLDLKVDSPLSCVLKYGRVVEEGNIVCRQRYEIQSLQKHIKLQGQVKLTVQAMFKEDDEVCKIKETLDLGWPLVSSITCLWDRWLLGDRCKSTAV